MKKGYIIAGVSVLIVVFAVAIWPRGFNPEDVTNYPPAGNTVVAFGDSLVEGVGSSQPGGFVRMLSDDIGVSIINEGVSGNTTAQGLARIEDVLTHDPDVALLLLGGNDFLRRVSKKTTEQNLGVMIERFQENGMVVILLGVRGGLLGDGYDNMYEDLSREYGTALVPNVLEGLIGEPDLMYDAIHPNDVGYRLIADRIRPILQDLVQ